MWSGGKACLAWGEGDHLSYGLGALSKSFVEGGGGEGDGFLLDDEGMMGIELFDLGRDAFAGEQWAEGSEEFFFSIVTNDGLLYLGIYFLHRFGAFRVVGKDGGYEVELVADEDGVRYFVDLFFFVCPAGDLAGEVVGGEAEALGFLFENGFGVGGEAMGFGFLAEFLKGFEFFLLDGGGALDEVCVDIAAGIFADGDFFFYSYEGVLFLELQIAGDLDEAIEGMGVGLL